MHVTRGAMPFEYEGSSQSSLTGRMAETFLELGCLGTPFVHSILVPSWTGGKIAVRWSRLGLTRGGTRLGLTRGGTAAGGWVRCRRALSATWTRLPPAERLLYFRHAIESV